MLAMAQCDGKELCHQACSLRFWLWYKGHTAGTEFLCRQFAGGMLQFVDTSKGGTEHLHQGAASDCKPSRPITICCWATRPIPAQRIHDSADSLLTGPYRRS